MSNQIWVCTWLTLQDYVRTCRIQLFLWDQTKSGRVQHWHEAVTAVTLQKSDLSRLLFLCQVFPLHLTLSFSVKAEQSLRIQKSGPCPCSTSALAFAPSSPPDSDWSCSQSLWFGTVVTFPPVGWWSTQDSKSQVGMKCPAAAVPCRTAHKKRCLTQQQCVGNNK